VFKPYKYTKELPPQKAVEKKKDFWELNIHFGGLGINWKRTLSTILVFSGLFLVTSQVFVPWLTTPRAQKPLLKPVSSEPQVAGARSTGIEVGFEFSELRQDIKTPNQAPSASVRGKQENIPEIFYVTVPKLGIERAEVETNSSNLSPDERLGHYAGSALPGEVGNTFIYGHSASPMFYDPKNYKTIFTTLDRLEESDEVTVEFGEKYFKYVVEKSVVLEPEDVKPLETVGSPFLKKSFLTLMTCVPPGIRTKRLLVQARLVL